MSKTRNADKTETVLQKTVRKDSCINGAKVIKYKARDRKSTVKGGQHTIN